MSGHNRDSGYSDLYATRGVPCTHDTVEIRHVFSLRCVLVWDYFIHVFDTSKCVSYVSVKQTRASGFHAKCLSGMRPSMKYFDSDATSPVREVQHLPRSSSYAGT